MLLVYNVVIAIQLHLSAATADLRGRVVDPSGRGVARVRLELQPGSRVVYSTPDGHFIAENLPPGNYQLSATAADFLPVSLRVTTGSSVTVAFSSLRAHPITIEVVGGDAAVALREIPGSAFLVDREELARSHPIDANEVLRRVPGVHIREDSGPVGMRLNIGIRGLNPDRSRTVLVLEDGLPLALAPYGEPEMYYSPPIDRMSRVEVLKGSGSIMHGPQTIGGVLNFVTPDPPERPQGSVELTGGQRGFFTGQAAYGGSKGRAGWYVNALRKQGDGWRKFWFDINDVTGKFNFAAGDRHRLGAKLGIYKERSNSTYLGLTETQFRRDPDFNAAAGDLLFVERKSGSVRHQWIVSPSVLISSGGFAYTTTRNWRRQDFTRSPSGAEVLLRDLRIHNNRAFDVAGVETRVSIDRARHRVELGARWLSEEHRDRRLEDAALRDDEVRDGRAVSAFVQDRIYLSPRFHITPGLRLERYRYARDIRLPAAARRGDSVTQAIPGIGAALQAAGPLTLFAGVHRGFAPPRVKDAITRAGVSLELDAERSWNYEAGARLALARGLRMETTLFSTDFQNQIIPASQSGGATSTLLNAGRTGHRGVEALVSFQRPAGFWSELRYTWLPVARFGTGIFRGNRLPYAPRNSLGLLGGYRFRAGVHFQIDGARAGDQFGDNRETRAPSADGTIGLLPAYWVWNFSVGQEVRRERFTVEPFVAVKNLANAIYVSSRAPQGIQPGMFRQVNGGVRIRF
ncbi:MAG: TonB-dependent receptor domain-containing protein [Bryobacteraceae bacterium]